MAAKGRTAPLPGMEQPVNEALSDMLVEYKKLGARAQKTRGALGEIKEKITAQMVESKLSVYVDHETGLEARRTNVKHLKITKVEEDKDEGGTEIEGTETE